MPERLWVLDTDHLSLLQRNHIQVVSRLRAVPVNRRATTVVSAEEQLRGRLAVIARARQAGDFVNAYAAFQETLIGLSRIPVLPFTERAADEFVRLKTSVRQVGTRDLKIAAIVLSVGGILVTRNLKDFTQVTGLLVEDWTQPLP
ncbi:MAG: type II toxin-antitoxin system VapC family toxin [Blastocatellia bacterium]|nr:type II toxin-antitoxin system VapC family toxin [Blastocatellia bacterium]